MEHTTKISETILEFGREVLMKLPKNHTKQDFEATMKIVIGVWNAVVVDAWNSNNEFETQLLKSQEKMPRETQIMIQRLFKRKKKKYGSDQRAVGEHWVREDSGIFIFGCEARINNSSSK